MGKGLERVLSVAAALAIIGIIAYLIIELSKKNKQIEKLEFDKLKLLKDSIEQDNKVTPEVDKQLKKLISHYQEKYPRIAEELKTALTIYNAGEKEKAVGSISICIENLLKELYEKDSKFQNWLQNLKFKNPKQAVQADYLEYSLADTLLTKEDFDYASDLRKVRNKVYHTAGVERPTNYNEANLLVGINIIFKIGNRFINPQIPTSMN